MKNVVEIDFKRKERKKRSDSIARIIDLIVKRPVVIVTFGKHHPKDVT